MVIGAEDEPLARSDVDALKAGLLSRGWKIGQDVQFDIRWGVYDSNRARTATAELLRLAPDVIVTNGTTPLATVRESTRTVPVVFTVVYEPVAQGFVESLAHPGGNITGFANVEPSIGGKWLELLKGVAPHVTRVVFVFNPQASPYSSKIYKVVEATASRIHVDAVSAPVHELSEVEKCMMTLSRDSGGLIFPQDAFLRNHADHIVDQAARLQLPAIYGLSLFPAKGGLISYGANMNAQFRQAAEYVDRILRGEHPADMPVQQPTKFELVINQKTAKALDLVVPETLLATADMVIE